MSTPHPHPQTMRSTWTNDTDLQQRSSDQDQQSGLTRRRRTSMPIIHHEDEITSDRFKIRSQRPIHQSRSSMNGSHHWNSCLTNGGVECKSNSSTWQMNDAYHEQLSSSSMCQSWQSSGHRADRDIGAVQSIDSDSCLSEDSIEHERFERAG
jgi:hypothetical protein